jgi:drug/metabolite transporter (DMT)-like permease
MDSGIWLGALLAIAASSCLNIGKGIQKWKVGVLAHRARALSAEHRRDLSIWGMGVGLTTGASVLFSLALKYTDKPSTVSALNGIGLIGLVVFAWLVLRERVGTREVGGAALIIAGTAILGVFDVPEPTAQRFDLRGFLLCSVVLISVLCGLAVYSWRTRRWHGLVFGSLAGSMIGTSMVLGDMALAGAGNDIFRQFLTPWVYLALLVGTGALACTQLAFWRSTAMVVVPTINSFVIFTPAIIQYFTFGTVLQSVQYLGIVVIIAGVVPLSMGEKTPAGAPVPALAADG